MVRQWRVVISFGESIMENQQHICVVCGHVHDEVIEGKWETLPDDFQCPECGVGKEDYYIL